MKYFLCAILLFCFGNFSIAQTKYVPPEKKLHLTLYTGVSFLKYRPQPGLFELSFPYARLDTATGGQIQDVFEFSKNNLIGNHAFTFPLLGMEMRTKNYFLRVDLHYPQRRRISQEHISFGYEWRKNFTEKEHFISLLAGVNKNIPSNIASIYVRGEIGIDNYKPVWLMDAMPVKDTSIFMMGYTIKRSESDVRTLRIYYEEDMLALTPTFTLGCGTNENRTDFSLSFSYFVPMQEKGGVRLLYKKNNTGWIIPYTWFWYPFKDVVQPGQHGLQEKYNGNSISKTPFRFSGFEILFRVGIRIR